jgi:CheY-like chemotaxis protein
MDTGSAASVDAHRRRRCYAEGAAVRCLIVDDNDRFLQVAHDLLERDGIAVVGVADTSAEALRRAEQLCPNVALIDVMLGNELGFDLAYALTQTVPKPPHVIMISTYAETEFEDMIAASPAIGFLTKTHLSGSAIRALLPNADTTL